VAELWLLYDLEVARGEDAASRGLAAAHEKYLAGQLEVARRRARRPRPGLPVRFAGRIPAPRVCPVSAAWKSVILDGEEALLSSTYGAQPIDGPAPSNDTQPGLWSPALLPARPCLTPDLEEDLLQKILRIGSPPEDSKGAGEDQWGIHIVQAAERLPVSCRNPLNQFDRIASRLASHRCLVTHAQPPVKLPSPSRKGVSFTLTRVGLYGRDTWSNPNAEVKRIEE